MYFNRFIVLFAALFISVVVTAQSGSLVTNQEYEREIRESQQFVIEKTWTNKSLMDDLFKPIDEQLAKFQETQQRAADLQNAEYVMIVLLLFFLFTLIYVFTENFRHIEKGKALENQKSKQGAILAKMLPPQSIQEYMETGEIAPVIWGDSLIVIVELLLPNPLPPGIDRRQIKEAISKENRALLAANGLVRIRVSGDRMLRDASLINLSRYNNLSVRCPMFLLLKWCRINSFLERQFVLEYPLEMLFLAL